MKINTQHTHTHTHTYKSNTKSTSWLAGNMHSYKPSKNLLLPPISLFFSSSLSPFARVSGSSRKKRDSNEYCISTLVVLGVHSSWFHLSLVLKIFLIFWHNVDCSFASSFLLIARTSQIGDYHTCCCCSSCGSNHQRTISFS